MTKPSDTRSESDTSSSSRSSTGAPPRSPSDTRTLEQIVKGVPYYRKQAAPAAIKKPLPAPAPKVKSELAKFFHQHELNRQGIPKEFENSPRFSYDKSVYFQDALSHKMSLTVAHEQENKDSSGNTSERLREGDKEEEKVVDISQIREPDEEQRETGLNKGTDI